MIHTNCGITLNSIVLRDGDEDRLCGLVAQFLATERRCIVLPVRYELNLCYKKVDASLLKENRPPLWSSGQSSWILNGDALCFCEVLTEYVMYKKVDRLCDLVVRVPGY
jgi:hypothetical protein